jgi:thioredoxin reductase
MERQRTSVLVIGAGPYGIATAAYAKYLGAPTVIVGKTLDFWKTNMPRGMFLRSGPDWHIDARDVATFESYVALRGLSAAELKPVPLDTFLDYASWFMGQYDVRPHLRLVTRLSRSNGSYLATLDDGSEISADKVVLSVGLAEFKYSPPEVIAKLPRGSYSHTCDTVDLEAFRGKRVLLVGGRQSAFEWAALMRERGADEIHVVHRHETPRFTEPDWSWVQPMVRRTIEDHGWWRRLASAEQEKIRADFWAAGRLTLEAWLGPRVHQPTVHMHEKTVVAQASDTGGGTCDVQLNDGTRMNVHRIVLATGYQSNMQNAAFLDRVSIAQPLQIREGSPVLDAEFQTNLPNLYIIGLAAARDFGPFFGFTVGCHVAARIVAEAVAQERTTVQV